MNKKALIVLTSNDKLGDSGQKTGWYLAEAAHVYWPLLNDGFEIEFASPKGGLAPIDMESCKLDDPENKSFVKKFNVMEGIQTKSLSEINPDDFSIIFFAGGHGTMWDFPENEDIQKLTSSIYENGGIVSAVCHGPAALTNVKLSDGKYLIEGKEINSFTNSEEREVKKDNIVPFMLETRLRDRGAKFECVTNWKSKIVVDDRLITGQNPQSAGAVGRAIVSAYARIKDSLEEVRRHHGRPEQRPHI